MAPDAITTIGQGDLQSYFVTLSDLLCRVEVTAQAGQRVELADAATALMAAARATHAAGNKLIFVGNGGSAAIASHMANDYSKNGDVRSIALNDASMLTCLGNDLGYDRVFAKQIELHARAGDLLVIFGEIPVFRVPSANLGGYSPFDIYIPILMSFSIAIIAFTYLPGPLVSYRELGILRRLSTTPVPAYWVLAAQIVVVTCLMVVTLALVVTVSIVFFRISAPGNPAAMALSIALCMAALFAIGRPMVSAKFWRRPGSPFCCSVSACQDSPIATSAIFPAAKRSVWRWHGRSRTNLRYYCSTSRPPHWTRHRCAASKISFSALSRNGK